MKISPKVSGLYSFTIVRMSKLIPWLLIILFLNLYLYAQAPDFGSRIDLGVVEFDAINEASGIAASRQNPNVLWTHNDSGDQNRIFAMNTLAKHLGVFLIEGVSNRDWEDIAVGPGPVEDQHYIYIGDIGDNGEQFELKYIYRVLEPDVRSNQSPVEITLSNVETITFRYPDRIHDAETLMVDPLSKDIFIVTKRENNVRVYRAPYPHSTTETIVLDHVATLSFTMAVGGDISSNGLEMLIKTYSTTFYWQRTPEQSWQQALINEPVTVPYTFEPQGEAVCWQADDMGYYTVSEEPVGIPAHLYFYPRRNPSVVKPNEQKPTLFQLEQNFPNPFNPTTMLQFSLFEAAHVTLKVYNLLGSEVAVLVDEYKLPGTYQFVYHAGSLESGVFYYRLKAGNKSQVRKFVVIK